MRVVNANLYEHSDTPDMFLARPACEGPECERGRSVAAMSANIQPFRDLFRLFGTTEDLGVLKEHTLAFHSRHEPAQTPPRCKPPFGNKCKAAFPCNDSGLTQVALNAVGDLP